MLGAREKLLDHVDRGGCDRHELREVVEREVLAVAGRRRVAHRVQRALELGDALGRVVHHDVDRERVVDAGRRVVERPVGGRLNEAEQAEPGKTRSSDRK